MSAATKSRCPRFESAEKKIVFDLVAKYKHIENKKTDAVTNDEKNKTWIQIAAEFNAICPGMHYRTYRSVESISKLWKNCKKVARQQAAQERLERIKTGGGSADIIKKDENYESVISILNEKTIFGFSNPFDSDEGHMKMVSDDKNSGGDVAEIENETVPDTHDNTEVIELIIDQSDFTESNNEENEYASTSVLLGMSSTPTTGKRCNENVRAENTWKKHKPADLQTPLNKNLHNAKSSTVKKNFDASRRRPTTQVRALTSFLVAQKYDALLEKRISIASQFLVQTYTLEMVQMTIGWSGRTCIIFDI